MMLEPSMPGVEMSIGIGRSPAVSGVQPGGVVTYFLKLSGCSRVTRSEAERSRSYKESSPMMVGSFFVESQM
eukprot:8190181-Heterocapsa_arctica.AAC.1